MRVTTVFILAIALTSGVAYSHTDLTPAEVQAMLDAGGDLVVLDVREESEFCDSTYQPPGHIIGAVNMPWNSGYLQEHYSELPSDHDIIVVCRSGNRSNSAANFLDGVGFTSVFDMLGGMNAWQWETEDCSVASVPGPGVVPAALSLGPAIPNPFSLETEISYAIPAENGQMHVTLSIYDSRGRLVARVVDSNQNAGSRRVIWSGTDRRGRPVASGVYFYRLASYGKSKTRRVVLLR